jgi:hypothetical protein
MRRTALRPILLLLAGLLLAEVLVDPVSRLVNAWTVANLRRELPQARARWESAGLADYQVDVRGAVPLGCLVAVRLVTRQGRLAEIQELPLDPGATPQALWTTPVPPESLASATPAPMGCNYPEYTIPQTFDTLARELDQFGGQIKIIFDPQYGYITHWEENSNYGVGLLNNDWSECCVRFDYSNFTVLP